jgi:hypothetical protein
MSGLAVLALLLGGSARAAILVLPNANTNVSGNGQQVGILDAQAGVTFQWV